MSEPDAIAVAHWERLSDGRLECRLCPRACRMRAGQRGLCFVRRAADDGSTMELTSYGLSSGFCVDPIEKKPLHHFLPGTSVLSFGTAGCNLACAFCQNHDISKSREVQTSARVARPKTIADAARRLGCASVAYTYNDPVVFLEYAVDTALACREIGIRNVAVTAGYVTGEARRQLFEPMDAVNIDLKAFSEAFYERHAAGSLAPVLETLRHLVHETEVWTEITTLLIPGENDDRDEIDRMTRWIHDELGPDVPLHFSAFHPDFRMVDKPATQKATLDLARHVALANGLNHVYVGNVRDASRQATICPSCGTRVIGRDWHEITDWRLDDRGACLSCGTPIAGRFDGPPGDWGRKRMPIDIERFAVSE